MPASNFLNNLYFELAKTLITGVIVMVFPFIKKNKNNKYVVKKAFLVRVLDTMDANGDGDIEFKEFVRYVHKALPLLIRGNLPGANSDD